jgi:diadenosine tetraphosphate (Ap4A) HIT family hydrolase
MIKEISNCVFCKENIFPYHDIVGLSKENAILYEDNHVFVTIDISPLCIGHLLIVSKNHYDSYANAPDCVRESVYNILEILKEKIFKSDCITFFEHGSMFKDPTRVTIDHAHIHVFPQYIDIKSDLEIDGLFCGFEPFTDKTLVSFKDKQSYIWLHQNNESILYKVKNLPGQYLRKIISKIYKLNDYNWKKELDTNPSLQKYIKTLDVYVPMFKDLTACDTDTK